MNKRNGRVLSPVLPYKTMEVSYKLPKRTTSKKGTRGAQGAGNIRQRKDGTWEARYTLGRDPGTGKQIQKSVYGKTQKEVLEKLRKVQTDIDNGVYTEPTKLTVGEWLDMWVSEFTVQVKERTRIAYQSTIKQRIKPAIGALKLHKLTAPQIQKFYNDLGRPGGERKVLSAKSIHNTHGVLHKALQQAVELKYIPDNPANACKLPRKEKSEIVPLDDIKIKDFLEAIKSNTYRILFTVDLFTGMRQGEILGLSWDAVDFETGKIMIKQQLQKMKGGYRIGSIKNDKPRIISPAKFVMDLLREQRSAQNRWMLAAGEIWTNPNNLVFTNEEGRHVTVDAIYKNCKRIGKEIGLPNIRFHDLRHTYAVASIRAGDDIKTVQSNLGHHTAAFTLDVYGHATDQMKQESANRMERFIEGLAVAQ